MILATLISISALIIVILLYKQYKTMLNQNIFYKDSFELISTPIFATDENYRFVGCNSAFCSVIASSSKDNVIGKNLLGLFVPDENAIKLKHFIKKQKYDEFNIEFELSLMAKDGTYKKFDVNITRNSLKHIMFFAHDNEKLKEASSSCIESRSKILELSKELKQKDREFELTFDMTVNGVAILDINENLVYSNRALHELTSYNKSYMEQLGLTMLFDEESMHSLLTVARRDGRVDKVQHICTTRSGLEVDVYVSIGFLDQLKQYVFVIEDITHELAYQNTLKKEKAAFRQAAIKDGLTNIYNRAYLNKILEEYVKNPKLFSLILFDIDHFKKINDTYGHVVGDNVLIELTKITQKALRVSDIFARFGGEEFVVILPRSSLDNATAIATKIKELIEVYPFAVVGQVTSSFGVTEFVDGKNVIELLEEADKALYISKENGRNQVNVYSEEK